MLPLISNTAVTSFADVVPNVHDIIFPYTLPAAAPADGAPSAGGPRIPVPIIPITKDAKSQV